MQGVSEVIAIILILMITIAISGLAYTFMSSTMASTTSAASSAVTSTTSSMLTSFTIENVDVAKVYLRNTGQNTISSLSVYVNDEPATYIITPTTIAAGQIGTVTIYSFIPDGATVKVTSPNGFSTSKVVQPCSKAIGCWKFDEASGSIAYDSSPNGISGTFRNATTWTSGKYGSALNVSTNGYVNFGNPSNLNTGAITVAAWVNYRAYGLTHDGAIITKKLTDWTDNGYALFYGYSSDFYWSIGNNSNTISYTMPNPITRGWTYVVGTFNGSIMYLYVDGVQVASKTPIHGIISNTNDFNIGSDVANSQYFIGAIDEVRIYDRAIY